MVAAVVAQRRNDGALAQQGFDYQLLIRMGMALTCDRASQRLIMNIAKATDVDRGVGPGALTDQVDHCGNP